MRFTRKQNTCGKYRVHVSLERGEKKYHCRCGPVHSIFNLKYRFVGDVPSVSAAIKSSRPKTIKGHIVKLALIVSDFIVRDAAKTGEDLLKASETAVITSAKEAARLGTYKLRDKYRENAVDDFSKGTIFIAKSAVDAVKGTRRHVKLKKQYKSEKLKYSQIKLDLKNFRNDFKNQKKEIKSDIQSARKKYKASKESFRKFKNNGGSTPLRRELYKQRRKQYRNTLKNLKSKQSDLKKENSLLKSEKSNQKKLMRASRSDAAILKPVKYYGNQLKESAVHKAASEEDNDMLKAAYEIKKHGTDHISRNASRNTRLNKHEKKRDRIDDKKNAHKSKLRKKESRFQNQKQTSKRRRIKRRQNSDGGSSAVSKFFMRGRNLYSREAATVLTSAVFPVIFILIVLIFIIMIFVSIISGSGFVIGTYCAQDYSLSQAEKYYTKLAWDMNEKVIMVGTSDWKKGLHDLGADTRDMRDTPDTVQWGKSSELNYDPVYDFDRYKLWSFLCAYYYDFSAADNGDIKYWKYSDDTKNVLKDLFDSEYTFEYRYNSSSHWEHLNRYDFSGGIDGTYWLADKNTVYTDAFHADSAPGEIYNFTDDNGFVHFSDSLEVLNAKDSYSRTGWYIQDQRYIVRDNSGQQSNPFYSWFNDREYGRMYGSNYYPRSRWGWGDNQCYWLVSPEDTLRWNNSLNDKCLVNYYRADEWVKNCSLYYNVKQQSSFEDTILRKLGSMSDSAERVAYYQALTGAGGSSYYGNHQTLKNILPGDTVMNYTLFNGFGWNITSWNSRHCNSDNAVHEGIDIVCSSGTEILAPFDCKIQSFSNGTVILRKNDVRYWYDGNKGRKRDTEVTIGNILLKSGYKTGDTIKQGESFAVSTADRKCTGTDNSGHSSYIHVQIQIDTDGIGWNYIDPTLILY